MILACVGIYAVISYSVAQRTREMGIRLALGAAPAAIRGMVLREGMAMAAAGIGAGVAAALALTRYLQSLLYVVTPTDGASMPPCARFWRRSRRPVAGSRRGVPRRLIPRWFYARSEATAHAKMKM